MSRWSVLVKMSNYSSDTLLSDIGKLIEEREGTLCVKCVDRVWTASLHQPLCYGGLTSTGENLSEAVLGIVNRVRAGKMIEAAARSKA